MIALGTAKKANNQGDSDCDDVEEGLFPQPLPSVVTIIETFQDIESSAYSWNVDGAIMYLRRAQRLFLDKKQKEGAPERHLPITEVL